MQKTSTFCFKNLFWIFLCLIWTGFSNAKAVAAKLNIEQLELGKTYEYSAFQEIYAQYTASEDGVLTITNSTQYGSFLNLFEAPYVSPTESVTIQQAVNGVLTVNVEAGKTYYFYQWMMDAGSFVAEMNKETAITLELISVYPEENSTISAATGSNISFSFNANIKVDDATLNFGSKSATLPVNITSERFVSVDITETLSEWFNNQSVKTGDQITLTLNNVRSAEDESIKYGSDGCVSINYIVPAKAVELTEVSGASLEEINTLLTYYSRTDNKGLITLTFDGNLNMDFENGPTATLSYGNLETGEMYREDVSVTVNGNTLTVDLRGKLRRSEDMLPGVDPTTLKNPHVALKIANIKDVNGEFVKASQPGATGSFSFTFNLETVDFSTSSSFTPQNKETLNIGDKIEIWIENGNKLKFDGIQFKYTEGGTEKNTVVYNFQKQTDELDENNIIINLTMPFIRPDENTSVTVSLYSVETPDGLDHSAELSYVYTNINLDNIPETLEILTASKADMAEIDQIEEGYILQLTTNMDAIAGYMDFMVKDITDDEIVKSMAILNKTSEGWESEFYSNLELKEGHTYEAIFTAYMSEDDKNYDRGSLGSAKLTWKGTTPPFEFSPIKLVSVTPEPGEGNVEQITEPEDFVITVTFDGGVDLNASILEGFGMTSSLKSCTSNEDKTVWSLVVGGDYLYGASETLSISVNATDAASGKRVKGDLGEEDQSYWIFSYDCTVNVPNITVSSAEGGNVSQFVVSCSQGISPSYMGNQITITKEGAEEPVQTISAGKVDLVIPDGSSWDYVPTECTFSPETLEDGTYTINIPRGFFILGVDMMTYKNKTTQYTFSVKNGIGPRQEMIPTEITPAATEVIYSLKTIKLKLAEAAQIKENAKARLSSRFGMQIEAPITLDPEDETGKTLLIILDNEVTSPGLYMLNIAAGSFGDADYIEGNASGVLSGNSNPDLNYTFTVSEVLKPIIVTPASGEQIESLSTLKFENVTGFEYAKEILVKNSKGETVATITSDQAEAIYDENNPWGDPLYITVTLATPITEADDYTIEIPEGFFYVGSSYDNAEAMTLTYHVTGKGTNVDQITTENNNIVTVYTLNGLLIAKDSEPAILKTLDKGIYIVNGKKMIIE